MLQSNFREMLLIPKRIVVRHIEGDLKNSRRNNALGFGTLVLITAAVVVMLGVQLLDLLGIRLFGS